MRSANLGMGPHIHVNLSMTRGMGPDPQINLPMMGGGQLAYCLACNPGARQHYIYATVYFGKYSAKIGDNLLRTPTIRLP